MLTATHKLEFKSGERTSKKIVEAGTQPDPPVAVRIPRITKMMALAIRLDHLIKSGQVIDQAELARLGNVSRARITQILDLLHLSPLIQEDILLAPSDKDCSRIREKNLRTIAQEFCWIRQLSAWNALSTEQAAQPSNL